MTDDDPEIQELLQRAATGEAVAFQELFSRYRDRLKRMVHLRMSRRLQGRVDDSDVLQEALLDAGRRLPGYVADPKLPSFLWLRHLTAKCDLSKPAGKPQVVSLEPGDTSTVTRASKNEDGKTVATPPTKADRAVVIPPGKDGVQTVHTYPADQDPANLPKN